ncbi:hypothetical protein [Altererythrobacter sp. Z27]|uniref:hypothetical protein n=1 Tax=Altererythrobacter sp. Z27 TaxID=3461147 RepID=UPI00404509A1
MGLSTYARGAIALGALALPGVLSAQAEQGVGASQAAGVEVFYSSDSDDTSVLRTALDLDFRNDGAGDRIGLRLEKAWYEPSGLLTEERERAYLRFATKGNAWTWETLIGTDGDDLIGSVSIHDDSRYRKEFFVERDIVETPMGLESGIYSTFAGAAIDIPLDERNVMTVLTGAQLFTGDNVRLHLRGNYVHVLKPEWGLSVQMRGRYFRSSDPGEFDYYSPRSYAQLVPVVQLRRFVDGWQLLAAGGIGIQKDSATDWQQANFAQLRVISPASGSPWSVSGELTYTQTPANGAVLGEGYDYVQSRLSVMRRF